jgi:hypothetical protein
MSTPTNPTGVEAAVCEDIARRQQLGIQKYGGTVADNPAGLREWLQHAYEECLDQAVYLKRAMEDLVRMGYGDIRLVQPETPLKPQRMKRP